jgi:DNA-binding NarL/FixJ family response regulator
VSEPIRIVIVDDHDLVREGLRSVLGQHDDIAVVAEASSAEQAIKAVLTDRPDLVLLDLRLGDRDGIEVATRVRDEGFSGRILVLSIHDTSQDLRAALAAGADGYLLKSVSGSALADGIRRAMAGEAVIGQEFVPKLIEDAVRGPSSVPELTGRERQVLDLIAAGNTNRAIAEELEISTRTAQKHVENLFKKLGVHDRTELVSQAFRRGLLG